MAVSYPHLRTPIRRYLVDLLKSEVDVGGKVFPNRPSPIFLNETPCVLVYFATESAEIIVGDKYNPKEYERTPQVNIDVLSDEVINPAANPNESQETEDRLDFYSWQIEQAIWGDQLLAKNLDGYDPDNPCGLTLGISLLSNEPYNIDTGSDRRIVAQRNAFSVPYNSIAYREYRYKTFEEYNMKINKVGWDLTTVDPTLNEAEGKL